MSTDRLNRARAELAAAEEEVKKQQRAADEQKLREYNLKGRDAKELFESFVRQYNEADHATIAAEAELEIAESQLARHDKPAITEFPTDEEVAQWEAEHARLTARSQRARTTAIDAKQNREQIRLKLLQANQDLQGFQRAVLQLTQRLEQNK